MKSKTIWLTGCSSGLGRALVNEFTSAGHTVAGCARREDRISKLREAFPKPHYFSAVDVSNDSEVENFCREAYAQTGAPDLVINNAAIINDPAPLWQISAEDFDHLTDININGTANVIRHVVPLMKNNGGVIVNLSSGWGRSTAPEVAPYCASKWAIEGLTQALAQELPAGLAAVAMNPGVINTAMLQTCYGEHADNYSDANTWSKTAAPFLLELDASNNGEAITAP
ncbi:MAG: SDR family NAD(P)-dependent oxidoreductase [Akkermansiaceae bacterium]|nr:SDR family NAD(P)-dependent oxidoreductase [Akkermansiaceae bacterium]